MADQTSVLPLWRVWREDGRYKLISAENERQALRQVRGATKAEPAADRTHPRQAA